MWARRIATTTKKEFKQLFDEKPKDAVGIIKDDWYGLDQLYVRDHPESNFWRVIMPNPNPPSYLPFVKDKALHQQFAHIRKYYSEQEDKWFLSLPYQYLNQETMTCMVNDSIEAVLLVYDQVKGMEKFDGFEEQRQSAARNVD